MRKLILLTVLAVTMVVPARAPGAPAITTGAG